jgi:Tfp pilus assembly pilus retraction ATPase PilT
MFSVMNELDQEGILGDTITIEHPVEYLHQQPHIEQRRVGFDTASFDVAIVEAMRLTPKTIVIGEIRDRATADAALTAGLTGHRVLATLHARNASEAIVRMINLLPEDRQPMLGIAVQGLMVQMLEAVPNSPVIPVYESLLIDDPVAAILSKGAGMLQQLNHEFRRQRRPRMTEMREELVRAGVISSHG